MSFYKKSIIAVGVSLLFISLTFIVYQFTKAPANVVKPVFYVTSDSPRFSPREALLTIRNQKGEGKEGFFNPGFGNHPWWVFIPTGQYHNAWLQVANPHINILRIYTVQSDSIVFAYQSGDYYSFKERLVKDPDFWFPIPANSKGLLLKIDKSGESLFVPLSIIPEKEMVGILADQKAVYGFFAGWFLFLIILNIFLGISLKEQIHFYYILYVATSVLWMISNWGIGFQYIWPENTDFASKSRPVFASFSFVFMLELCKQFFTRPDQLPQFTRPLRFFQLLLLVLIGMLLLARVPEQPGIWRSVFLAGLSFVWLGTIFVIAIYIYKNYKHFKTLTHFFVAALSILMVFAVMNILAQFSVEADWVIFVGKYGSAIGILSESTILSFGLSRRYDYYKKEKEAVQHALETEKALLADRLIQVQEEERSRLARELHDGMGGLLGSIRIGAFHQLKDAGEAQHWIDKQLEDAIEDLRNIAHDLMPVHLQEKGLVHTLEKTVSRWNAANDFVIHLHCGSLHRYPLSVEAGIYRIVTELLYNVKKHAAATEVFLSVWEEENRIVLMVEDNGKGFDPNNTEGLGWKNIRYRVQYLEGKVSVDSNEKGTTIIIEVTQKQ